MGSRFVKLAREAGYDSAQLAMLWVKDQPGITAHHRTKERGAIGAPTARIWT